MIGFDKLVRTLIRMKGMSHAEVAARVGVKRPVITMVLARTMKLPLKHLDPLLDALGVSGEERERLRFAHMASVCPTGVRKTAERAASAATAKVMSLPAVKALIAAEEKFGDLTEDIQRGARMGYYGAIIDQMQKADVITVEQHKALEDRLQRITMAGQFPEIVAKMALHLTSAIPTAGKEQEFEELIRCLGKGMVKRVVDAAKGARGGWPVRGARKRRS